VHKTRSQSVTLTAATTIILLLLLLMMMMISDLMEQSPHWEDKIPQLVKNFRACYGTRRYIDVL
jgi:hypothetical protein